MSDHPPQAPETSRTAPTSPRRRPSGLRAFAGLLAASLAIVLTLVASCGPTEDNGDVTENGSEPIDIGPIEEGEPFVPPTTAPAIFDLPDDPTPGHWVERRSVDTRQGQDESKTLRRAILSRTDAGEYWVEEAEDATIPGEWLVWRLRVSPEDGSVLEAWVGLKGTVPQKAEVPEFGFPDFPPEPDATREGEEVTVSAGTFVTRVQEFQLEGGETLRMYHADEVGYDHLVKVERPGYVSELVGFGDDAKSWLKPPPD